MKNMKQKLNRPLIRKIIRGIKRHPDQFIMSDVFSDYLDAILPKSGSDRAGGCGTAACIAGWALHFSAKHKTLQQTYDDWRYGGALAEAAKLIGVPSPGRDPGDHDRHEVFYTSNWPRRFRERFERAKTPQEQAAVAIARLEYLLKCGK